MLKSVRLLERLPMYLPSCLARIKSFPIWYTPWKIHCWEISHDVMTHGLFKPTCMPSALHSQNGLYRFLRQLYGSFVFPRWEVRFHNPIYYLLFKTELNHYTTNISLLYVFFSTGCSESEHRSLQMWRMNYLICMTNG